MTTLMGEIDELREVVRVALEERRLGTWYPGDARRLVLDMTINEARFVIENLLRVWWSQGCKEKAEGCEECGGSGYVYGGERCTACEPWVPKEKP